MISPPPKELRVGEKGKRKAKSYQTNNQTTEIKEATRIILTFSLHSDSCVRMMLVWEPAHNHSNYSTNKEQFPPFFGSSWFNDAVQQNPM